MVCLALDLQLVVEAQQGKDFEVCKPRVHALRGVFVNCILGTLLKGGLSIHLLDYTPNTHDSRSRTQVEPGAFNQVFQRDGGDPATAAFQDGYKQKATIYRRTDTNSGSPSRGMPGS